MNYLDSDREHTCRDFSQIRQWTHMRYNQSLTGDEIGPATTSRAMKGRAVSDQSDIILLYC